MPTLSSVPEETPAEVLKSNVELIISDYLGGQWNGNMRDDLVDYINRQIKSVFDELESELDDGKNSHSMKVISSAIQKIRSRYE